MQEAAPDGASQSSGTADNRAAAERLLIWLLSIVFKSSEEALTEGHLLPLLFLDTPKACRHGVVGALQRLAAVLLGTRINAPAMSVSTPLLNARQLRGTDYDQRSLIGQGKFLWCRRLHRDDVGQAEIAQGLDFRLGHREEML